MTKSVFRQLQLAFVVLMLSICAVPAAADGLIVIHDPPDASHVPHGHFRFAPLEVRHHHVNVTINDQVATTEIDQIFYNPHNRRLEGTYLFPIPKGAQIDKFAMNINGEMVQAELLDAASARKIYEDIVRSMKDPALLEYAEQGLFKVRIFPIEPHSEKRVQLKYTEVLTNDSGMIGYRYPLNTEKFSAAPIGSVSLKVNVTTASPMKTLYCPSHDTEIVRKDERHATIGFELQNARPNRDFQLYYAVDDSASNGLGFNVLTYRPNPAEPGYFMMLMSPSMDVATNNILPKDIIFVLDTSGSMAGKKLEQAQNALRFCLANLNERDRFEIVRFSTEAEPLFASLVDASKDNRAKATKFVDEFQARGGTDISSALSAAIDAGKSENDTNRPFMIVFMTDGRPTVGTRDQQQIVDAVKNKLGERSIRVFCFGIGTDVNTQLLDKVAQQTRAATEYVLPEEDIEIKVSNFYTKVDSPVLANPQLSVQGVKLTKMHPRELPDVFKGEQVIVFGRYDGSGDAAISIEGNLGGAKRTLVYEENFAKDQTNNEFISRLWATRRVGWLLDEVRLHGESAELRDEVTQLAKMYGIITPYTSYLILEDEGGLPVAFRAGRERDMDLARKAGASRYGTIQESTGRGAVETAAKQRSMQDAGGFGGGAGGDGLMAGAEMQQEWLGVSAPASRSDLEPTQFVRGRAFYYTGKYWIDSTITDKPDEKRKEIEFGSDEYFDLLKEHPDASAWLALGQQVQLRLGNTVYVIE